MPHRPTICSAFGLSPFSPASEIAPTPKAVDCFSAVLAPHMACSKTLSISSSVMPDSVEISLLFGSALEPLGACSLILLIVSIDGADLKKHYKIQFGTQDRV